MLFYWLSERGTYHKMRKEKNQDSVSFAKKGRYASIALADGVSTCENAGVGAEITSKALTNLFIKNADFFFDFAHKKDIASEIIVSHILYKIEEKTKCDNIISYSSTAACVLYDKGKKRLMYYNLGDSLIVATKSGICNVLSMPFDSIDGCPVTTTENAYKIAKIGFLNNVEFDCVLIFSDGAWKNLLCGKVLSNEAINLIMHQSYSGLSEYINTQNFDDYSFISINLKEFSNSRRAA